MRLSANRGPARRTRRWVADIEGLENRLVLSSAAEGMIQPQATTSTVFLDQAGSVSKVHTAKYPVVLTSATTISVYVSTLPHTDKVELETSNGRKIKILDTQARWR